MYFKELYNAISDIELNLKLGVRSLLIKDYKSYSLINQGALGVGLSSTFVPMKTLISHFGMDSLVTEMDKLMTADKKLGLFGVISLSMDKDLGDYRK